MTATTSPPPSLPRVLLYLSLACTASAAGGFALALAGSGVPPLAVLVAPPLLVLAWCAYRWLRPAAPDPRGRNPSPQDEPPDTERLR